MLTLVTSFSLLHATSASGVPRSSANGYRSSEQWLPREPVITSPTGYELVGDRALMANFDWRDVGGRNWVTPDINQHIPVYCGACWVHGGVSTLNDRIKIMRQGKFPDVMLSRQALINCVPDPSGEGPPPGCNGGDAWMLFSYMQKSKIPDDSCMPYVGYNEECVPTNICRNCFHNMTIMPDGHPFFTPGPCFGVKHFTGYGVTDIGVVKGEEAMMREIYARGPIACSAATDDTFSLNYSTNEGILAENVYVTDTKYTTAQIDHVMEVTGWGETPSGLKYWVVRNSWGTYWGDMGWVKIRRGVNQQQIESGCVWAMPDVQDVEHQLKSLVLGDYVRGITTKPLPAILQVETRFASVSDAKIAQHGNTTTYLFIVALAAGLSGIFLGHIGTHRVLSRRPLHQPNLLG